METVTDMDWVERRAKTESAVKARGELLWSHLRIALEQAADSYRKFYGTDRGEKVRVTTPYADVLTVARLDPMTEAPISFVTVTFKGAAIEVEIKAGGKRRFPIELEDESNFVLNFGEERLPVEDLEKISERILKPVFFPDETA